MHYAQLHRIRHHQFWLSANRAIFWENHEALIVSDVHIGKTGHFRKAGIGVSPKVYVEDLQRLLATILFFKVSKLIIVGDLSHSKKNKELDLFSRWRNDFPSLQIDLVKGNHDILDDLWYNENNITLHHHQLCIDDLCFCHDLDECTATQDQYIISGHLHPGVKLRGMGKQAFSLPCFYFTERFGVLPAFSHFTGNSLIKPNAGENVYAIADNQVLKIK